MALPSTRDELDELLRLMVSNNFCDSTLKCFSEEIFAVSGRCHALISKDHTVKVLCNSDGSLCTHYPPSLFLSPKYPLKELIDLISQAKYARCRTRFVVPSFEFNGKNVCRSSTLSVQLEVYARQVASAAGFNFDGNLTQAASAGESSDQKCSVDDGRSTLARLRDDDCQLMKRLQVTYICDLMLEYRKVKYWVPISSSEKADAHSRYQDFTLLALPYPGSEFFRVWRDSGYPLEGLRFDWDQTMIDVELQPESIPTTSLSRDVDWANYKAWDLSTLTVNYLKLFLGLLSEGDGGLLLHCVSGWDRTPLFVSLLRCLLWSERLMHRSLSAKEMLYYTLAYDWFLFGHQLRTRMEAGEEVLRFAFAFLGHLANRHSEMCFRKSYDAILPADEVNADGEPLIELDWPPNLIDARRRRLSAISELFTTVWDNVMSGSTCEATIESIHRPSSCTDPHELLVNFKTPENEEFHVDCLPVENSEPAPTSVVSQIFGIVSWAATGISSRFTNSLMSYHLSPSRRSPSAPAESVNSRSTADQQQPNYESVHQGLV